MSNRYAGPCSSCGAEVPVNGGELRKVGRRWRLRHLACAERGGPAVSTSFRTSGGTFYRNSRGRCEDAPCCGCCT